MKRQSSGAPAGLLKFGTDFTSDVCVYPERFAFTYVNGSNIALGAPDIPFPPFPLLIIRNV